MKVKVIGAGSIGCHMAHASRKCGWDVVMTDIDPLALERAKNEIFPTRYGTWYPEIEFLKTNEQDNYSYDIVIVGTPPTTHLEIAMQEFKNKPRAILIEKPLSQPDLKFLDDFLVKVTNSKTKCFVGYDHAVSESCIKLSQMLLASKTEIVETIDVEFKESWDGILAAHSWLKGPEDSYLGYTSKGGGALCEHSHGLNLWQHFARTLKLGRISEVSAKCQMIQEGDLHYDKIVSLNLITEKGYLGRCVQDMFSKPTSKLVSIQTFDQGNFTWKCEAQQGRDLIKHEHRGTIETREFPKTRPQDFITELRHIEKCLNYENIDSPIDVMRGVETMCVISAGLESAKTGKTILVNYPNNIRS
ncbi:Gfo/Idh/MocA family oxidoreductase [Alphaproteobacteria bacterium]|nr:Gfo/Idh/MocA family oxidoreductase [Alphaproteobacteria bacterium]